MAKDEQLAILKAGWREWNKWREENPEIKPNLSDAYLSSSDVSSYNLRRMDLSGTDFRNVWFTLRNLSDVDWPGANLSGAHFGGADLEGADLSGANLTGADLHGTRLILANLDNADFRGADLSRSALIGASAQRANFEGVDLSFAILAQAKMSQANLRRAKLIGANLDSTSLVGADLCGVDLTNAALVNTRLTQANISDCRIYGISAWDVNLSDTAQHNLIITRDKPEITVDNLEVAQFIYLLLNNKKIRDVINTLTTNAVLILGRFGDHKVVLEAIRDQLRKRDYLPILFDFDKPAARNITETVRTLAHLSRFIIADLTDPSSIPQELYSIIPTLAVAVQPVLESGKREYSMFVDLRTTYHWVLPIHEYKDTNDLLASLGDKVIAPAEAKARQLEKRQPV